MTWFACLGPAWTERAETILERVRTERLTGETIYPPQEQVLRALELTPPERTKVVLLGQDPYHGPGQANGLSFSVSPGTPLPPSLRNIFREYCDDLGLPAPRTGDLTPWAERGVLLLNAALTVRAGAPLSHRGYGWRELTGAVLRACMELPQPVVFLLWGGAARSLCADLPLDRTPGKAAILSSHPSPLGARKASADVPAFLGSRPFSRANEALCRMGGTGVDWRLP